MSTAFTRRQRKLKLKSEINVVPYIDVMLVLLIIFMVTAPLLNLGVDIDLPHAGARPLDSKKDSIIVSVDAEGRYTIKLQDGNAQTVNARELTEKVGAFVRNNPEIGVYVAGDGKARYQTVMDTMALLQTANVAKLYLMSKPAEEH